MSGRARRATRPTSCLFGAALGRSELVLRADFGRWAASPYGVLVSAVRESPEVGRVS
jgi:hypothetical protein